MRSEEKLSYSNAIIHRLDYACSILLNGTHACPWLAAVGAVHRLQQPTRKPLGSSGLNMTQQCSASTVSAAASVLLLWPNLIAEPRRSADPAAQTEIKVGRVDSLRTTQTRTPP